jgi:hypothetical protein
VEEKTRNAPVAEGNDVSFAGRNQPDRAVVSDSEVEESSEEDNTATESESTDEGNDTGDESVTESGHESDIGSADESKADEKTITSSLQGLPSPSSTGRYNLRPGPRQSAMVVTSDEPTRR